MMYEVRSSFYCRYVKRFLDIVLSLMSLIILLPVLFCIALLVRINLGSPIIFSQIRPGLKKTEGKEKLFRLYKFRTMTSERDSAGNLLPDDARLTSFGKILRSTSLDELPELWCILKGDMSIVGPRPQLVRDMVFMTEAQRKRHDVRPGLSGLAQVKGRNALEWEDKLNYDLEYLKNISFYTDMMIVFSTFKKVICSEDISYEGMATSEDYGDYLLRTKKITLCDYKNKQNNASIIMENI